MMEEKSFKFACPHCGQHVEADLDMVGITLDCPSCGKPFNVPEAGDTPSVEAETARPVLPVITVIRRRERFFDRLKKRWKMVGIGAAVLLLFVSIGVVKENSDGAESAATERSEGLDAGKSTAMGKSRKQDATENKVKAVIASIDCLLSYVEMPNNRRLGVLSKSLEMCPEDFADAVKEFLVSASRTSDDMISDREREDMIKGKLALGLIFGAVNKNDPQSGVAAGLQLGDLISAETRESANRRLKQEIESKLNHLLDVAQRYGINPNKLETALLNRMR